jgi:hypothetical protein
MFFLGIKSHKPFVRPRCPNGVPFLPQTGTSLTLQNVGLFPIVRVFALLSVNNSASDWNY